MPIYLQYWQLRCAFVCRRRNGLKVNRLFQGMVYLVGRLLERLGAPWGEITFSSVCKKFRVATSPLRCFCCRPSLLSPPRSQALGSLCGLVRWRRLLPDVDLQQPVPMYLNKSIRTVLIYFLHIGKLLVLHALFFIFL